MFEFRVGPKQSAPPRFLPTKQITRWWNLGESLNLKKSSKGSPAPLNIPTPTPAPDRGRGLWGEPRPINFARLIFSASCERKLRIIAAAFDVCHVLSVSLRSFIDVANIAHTYAPIIAQAGVLVRDHVLFQNSSQSGSETLGTDSWLLTRTESHD